MIQIRKMATSSKELVPKCIDCKKYTLKEKCSKCGHETTTVHPGKYSPDDKYARYRISDRYK